MGVGKCEGMIQDISPKHLVCEYHEYRESEQDTVILICEGKFLTGTDAAGQLYFPKAGELFTAGTESHYLFSIDDEHYVLNVQEAHVQYSGFEYRKLSEIRGMEPKYRVLAAATAWHLYNWYADNRFCGRCGKELTHDKKLRMLKCSCGNQIFPRISPAVIVGVTRKDEILVTKYAGREYKKYALVAGFTEIGETAEETVAREVMEEVGLKVKNITYYKSQPWGFSGTLLLGYFCEVEDDSPIIMDEKELSVARWMNRDELEEYTEGISLTGEMMNVFKSAGK
ncbi:MAG: NAD(+) diphosphatase [Lachnospiraceae bacterium]